jgi:SAM-dependent methyltransferase
MSSPRVLQSQYLSDAFRRTLERHRPASVAVLGCATGNGFEHLAHEFVREVVAVDINPSYLEVLRTRHGATVPGLETVCADLARYEFEPESLDLVWAGLIFEYVDPELLLEKTARWLTAGGVLSIVLQLPVSGHSPVTDTPFASVKRLEPILKLVDPRTLERAARRCGLIPESSRTARLSTGKAFHETDYRKSA